MDEHLYLLHCIAAFIALSESGSTAASTLPTVLYWKSRLM